MGSDQNHFPPILFRNIFLKKQGLSSCKQMANFPFYNTILLGCVNTRWFMNDVFFLNNSWHIFVKIILALSNLNLLILTPNWFFTILRKLGKMLPTSNLIFRINNHVTRVQASNIKLGIWEDPQTSLWMSEKEQTFFYCLLEKQHVYA